MTREELLKIAKPMLFNTDMVREILEDRKTATRRAIKYKYSNTEMRMRTDKYGTRLIEIQKNVEGETYGKHPDGRTWQKLLPYIEKTPPCKKGDTLYPRETWGTYNRNWWEAYYFMYRADYPDGATTYTHNDGIICDLPKWRPSIHMPKEAARIFLKVKDVRVERLQEMTEEDAIKEGVTAESVFEGGEKLPALCWFPMLWNSTIKKSDLELYGWDVNPWVWVIEFERIECE